MSWRTKIMCSVGVVTLCMMVVGCIFWRNIRIVYHRDRLWAAVENFQLLSPNLGNPRSRPPTILEQVKFSLFRMTDWKEQEAMLQHQESLLKLGYLEKREFWLTNRIFTGWSNIWPTFQRQLTNTFDSSHWCTYNFPETNKFEVTATPADMPKWEKLISDFDRQQH